MVAWQMGDKVWGARLHLLAGALGRCVAVSVMFPVDTVKTRLQLHGANCCSPLQWSDALRRPLFRGVGSSLMGQVPNGMLVYGSYELYKREISERLPSLDTHHVRLLAALISDVTVPPRASTMPLLRLLRAEMNMPYVSVRLKTFLAAGLALVGAI